MLIENALLFLALLAHRQSSPPTYTGYAINTPHVTSGGAEFWVRAEEWKYTSNGDVINSGTDPNNSAQRFYDISVSSGGPGGATKNGSDKLIYSLDGKYPSATGLPSNVDYQVPKYEESKGSSLGMGGTPSSSAATTNTSWAYTFGTAGGAPPPSTFSNTVSGNVTCSWIMQPDGSYKMDVYIFTNNSAAVATAATNTRGFATAETKVVWSLSSATAH